MIVVTGFKSGGSQGSMSSMSKITASSADVGAGKMQAGTPRCPIEGQGSAVEFKFEKNGYHIYENLNTGLLFVYPLPSQEDLNQIYKESYFERGRKYTPPGGDRTTDPQLVNDVKKLELIREHNGGKRLLDVGSAMGGFMKVASEAGYSVEGVEISRYGAEYTRTELGLPVHACSLSEATLPSNSFDVVTMWDVIEHLPDPLTCLMEVSRVLRPGGLCFITTGDVSSWYARRLGKRWHLMTPPQHLFYFTPNALKGALAMHDMSAIDITWKGKHASLDFALFKAGETLGSAISPIRTIVQKLGLARRRLYVNLGDIMTIISRKGDRGMEV